MIYGIFSDVHGNMEGLEVILARLRALGAERFICLGDLVGYGAEPNECIERVREVADIVLAGNHDCAAVGRVSADYFNPFARMAVVWTGRELTPENSEYLRSLPFTCRFGRDFYAVHATPCSPESWDYIMAIEDAQLQFDCFPEQACFVGHSHLPLVAWLDAERRVRIEPLHEVTLESPDRCILNVGSVGQPRDGDPRAAAALLDDGDGRSAPRVTLVRETYDVARTQSKILAAGLPPVLAARLATGH